ncbi:hypothetical protein FS749_012033, partial [Ceratobasidium sp. UAMH 11750]
TLEFPKPTLPRLEDTSVEKAREATFLQLCGSPPRTSELSDALTFLRAARLRRTSFTSSSSSGSSSPHEPQIAPCFTCNTVSAGRIIEWRRRLELGSPVGAPSDFLPSFLPSCHSSSATSSASYQDKHSVYPTTRARVEYTLPREPPLTRFQELFSPVQDETTSEADNEEDEPWPYDGKGLYEHHSRRECGNACLVSCQLRRNFRPRRFAGLARFVSWLKRGKSGGTQRMRNSDVPHPPWELEYRSNDDSLEEDHDDGDLEVWLDYMAEKQRVNHELRLELCLDGRPDSRIFSF